MLILFAKNNFAKFYCNCNILIFILTAKNIFIKNTLFYCSGKLMFLYESISILATKEILLIN